MSFFNPFNVTKTYIDELYSLSQKGILAKQYCSCVAWNILEGSVHRERESSVKYSVRQM